MGIYVIRCLANGKEYVGRSVNAPYRLRRHSTLLRQGKHFNPHLQAAWIKYGEMTFVFEVLEHVTDKIQLVAREQRHIDNALKLDRAFNICAQADGTFGRPCSEVTRQRIAEKATGRIGLRGSANARYGQCGPLHPGYQIPRSVEDRDKVSLGRSGGRRHTLISPDGQEYKGVINLSAFAREHDLSTSRVSALARGEYAQTKGWRLIIENPAVSK